SRKVQSTHRLAQFLPRDDMTNAHAAEMSLVEQRQAGREKFAINDAFAEPWDDAETDAARQLGQRLANAAQIVRVDMLEPVAKYNPVDRSPVALGARLARVPDQLGIKAGTSDLESFGIDLTNQVKVDEAVVDRSNKRVRARREVAREYIVAPRRIGHEIVGPVDQARHLRVEFLDRRTLEHLEARGRQRDAAALCGILAVFQIAVESALARVEVDSRDTPAETRQRNREMDCAGRFTRSTLFVGKDDAVRCGRRHDRCDFPVGGAWEPHRWRIGAANIGGRARVQI